jgi:hypothetical protein
MNNTNSADFKSTCHYLLLYCVYWVLLCKILEFLRYEMRCLMLAYVVHSGKTFFVVVSNKDNSGVDLVGMTIVGMTVVVIL